MKLIDGSLLMGHEYLACALVYQVEIGKTPSRSNAVLHHAPEAFDGIEVMATRRWEQMEAKPSVPVLQGRGELVGPMDTAPIHDHHDLFLSWLLLDSRVVD
jgi:hypothetical protein